MPPPFFQASSTVLPSAPHRAQWNQATNVFGTLRETVLWRRGWRPAKLDRFPHELKCQSFTQFEASKHRRPIVRTPNIHVLQRFLLVRSLFWAIKDGRRSTTGSCPSSIHRKQPTASWTRHWNKPLKDGLTKRPFYSMSMLESEFNCVEHLVPSSTSHSPHKMFPPAKVVRGCVSSHSPTLPAVTKRLRIKRSGSFLEWPEPPIPMITVHGLGFTRVSRFWPTKWQMQIPLYYALVDFLKGLFLGSGLVLWGAASGRLCLTQAMLHLGTSQKTMF